MGNYLHVAAACGIASKTAKPQAAMDTVVNVTMPGNVGSGK
jgi:hypothetical protein